MADEEVAKPVWNDPINENPGPVNDEGIPEGQGVLTFVPPPQGDDEEEKPPDCYAGNLASGVRQGSGKYTWSDGTAFSGSYKQGAKHGQGTVAFADGSKYEGTFEKGVVCGEGTWTYSNGDIYQGSFAHGKKHGEGCYHFANAQCQFIGTFNEGAFVGGRWVLRDGSSIAADTFVPGKPAGVYMPSGAATCKFGRPGLQQVGDFKPGMRWVGQQVSAA